MRKRNYIIAFVMILLFCAACGTNEKNGFKEPSPVEQMKQQQEVIENAQESDRQLEEQLEEIPFE